MSLPALAPPEGVVADLENPTDVLRTINFATQALTLTLCSTFLFIRGAQKFRMATPTFSVDDYLTVFSWLFLVAYCVFVVLMSVHGGGYHLWEVTHDELVRFKKAFYAATLAYALMVLFIKLSILSLIARVFAPYKRRTQAIYVLGAFLVIYYITTLILKIRVCWPISAYWRGEHEKCVSQSALITADAIISIVTDVIILLLPLPLTWSLQLPPKKKMQVGFMLAVGGLAAAFSGYRLHIILKHGHSPDTTILFVRLVLSANAEAGIAFICTCLPATVGQFRFLRDRMGYSSSHRTPELRGVTPFSSSGSAAMSSAAAAPRNSMKMFYSSTRPQAELDEIELVANAQGNATSEREDIDFSGIMRKVEVSHAVSFKDRELDVENNKAADGI